MNQRRDFLKKAGVATAGAVAATTVSAPYVKAQTQIKWRLQTYAGPALAEHVIKPSIDAFNKVANGDMVIELYTADQLVPTGELFRAMQRGTIDAVQSDDDSIAAPVDVSVFGGYFPFATRYSLDVPVLFNQYGLKEIWEEASIRVSAKSLYAVRHKARHPYDADARDFYKLFFLCEPIAEFIAQPGHETTEVGFFRMEALPPLSKGRVIEADIAAAYAWRASGPGPVSFD